MSCNLLTEFVKIYMSDMLPYKDELESGCFKVGNYANLDEGKKKPVKKKARSNVEAHSTSLQKAQEEISSKKAPPQRTVSSSASLPGFMRPKTGGTRSQRSTTTSGDNLPSHTRPSRTGQQNNNDDLPGYMRPKTGAIRNSGSASRTTKTSDLSTRPKTGTRTSSAKPEQDKSTKKTPSRANYFGYTPTG